MSVRRANHPLGGGSAQVDTTPLRFDYTGDIQEYIVPAGCKKIAVDCVAAKGYGTTAGGGRVECSLKVKPKQILYIYVGGIPESRNVASYNASDIRTSSEGITDPTSLSNRLIVAGAAGSQGAGNGNTPGAAGGGLIGADAANTGCSGGGKGGTQENPGSGGGDIPWTSQNVAGGAVGSSGLGGNGAANSAVGGAGGSGWYGGGGGAAGYTKKAGNYGAGGGGGSSYTDPDLCVDVVHTQGFNNENGYIIITPLKG